jgi:hypothetical protein
LFRLVTGFLCLEQGLLQGEEVRFLLIFVHLYP